MHICESKQFDFGLLYYLRTYVCRDLLVTESAYLQHALEYLMRPPDSVAHANSNAYSTYNIGSASGPGCI